MSALVPEGGTPAFGTFYMPGTQHTWLEDDRLYGAAVGTQTLADWLGGIVNGGAPSKVGP
jgi:hypothetical protein